MAIVQLLPFPSPERTCPPVRHTLIPYLRKGGGGMIITYYTARSIATAAKKKKKKNNAQAIVIRGYHGLPAVRPDRRARRTEE